MDTKRAEQKQFIVRVPPEVHKKAKILSAQTGKPLQQVLEEQLREWIAEQEEKIGRQKNP